MTLSTTSPLVLVWSLEMVLCCGQIAFAADCNGNGVDDAMDVAPQGFGFLSTAGPVAGQSPRLLSAGDLNGDGKPDIVTGNVGSSDVTVLLNRGDGRSMDSAAYPLEGTPRSVLVADLDGEGSLDIAAVASAASGAGAVSVLLNKGAGAFTDQGTRPVGGRPYSMTFADVDGDGDLDLATADNGCAYCLPEEPGGVSVLVNDGKGRFLPAVQYARIAFPSFILAADFNADGRIDLAASHGGNFKFSTLVGQGVWVLLNRGGGTFGEPYTYEAAGYTLLAADLDGDGIDDLAVPTLGIWDGSVYREAGVWVLLNKGDGTFRGAARYPAGAYPFSLAASDLNGDGKLDLLSANERSGDISLLLNTGNGTFGSAVNYPVGISPRAVIAADLDGDRATDVAVATYGTGDFVLRDTSVAVLLNDGQGNLGRAARYGILSGYAVSLIATDLNGDGRLDLAVANESSDRVPVMLNEGDGHFSTEAYPSGGYPPLSSAVADLDGDGRLDLAAVHHGCPSCDHPVQGGLLVALNRGDGSFQENERRTVPGFPVSMVTADLDGDGKTDIATAGEGPDHSGIVSVLLNAGASFPVAASYRVGPAPGSLAAADLNGDRKPDLVVTDRGSGQVSVLLNRGDGSFEDPRDHGVGPFPDSLIATDLDHDGALDLAVADAGCASCGLPIPGGLWVLMNRGDGSFEEAAGYAMGLFPIGVIAVDVDRDGQADLVALNSSCPGCSPAIFATVSVLRNDGKGRFAKLGEYRLEADPQTLVACDLNGDGRIDLAVLLSSGSISLLINGGDGTFQGGPTIPVGSSPRSLIAADLNGDGYQDLVTLLLDADTGASRALVLFNGGKGEFTAQGALPVGSQAQSIAVADLDGNSGQDLVITNSGGLVVLLSDLKAPFSTDLNRNGIPDECERRFHRGDPDSSGEADISDAIIIFGYLFPGRPFTLSCLESADTNNDGTIDISDGIYLLSWLFKGGPEPAAPGPTGAPCGVDPDAAGSKGDLGCESYTVCQ
jgi:hypothetical protein